MPNWCACKLEFDGPDSKIEEVFNFLCPDPNCDSFDFEKIIPIPSVLKDNPCVGLHSSSLSDGINEFLCGYKSIYDFCCGEWGTKWNASEVYANRTSKFLFFETAWCPPSGIYTRLSEMFPDVSFIASAFEGGCGICEIIRYENGSMVDEYYPEGQSKEWYELMFELEGGEDDYTYDPSIGSYRPAEEEDEDLDQHQ